MKAISFPEQTLIIAKDQPEYQPIPAHVDYQESIVTFCWKLTLLERLKLLFAGKLWHQVMTFHKELQPIRLIVKKPLMRTREEQIKSMDGYLEEKMQQKGRNYIGIPKDAFQDGSFNE